MPGKKTRRRRRKKNTSVWEKMNEPIAYPDKEFYQPFFAIALAIMVMAWAAPYWQAAAVTLDTPAPNGVEVGSHYEYVSFFDNNYQSSGRVAGAHVEAAQIENRSQEAPFWYDMISNDVPVAFGTATYEVLDISDSVQPMVDFYEPGVSAVWNAWLELMQDPY